jgi:hypothetical protein
MSKRKYQLVIFKSLDWQSMAMAAGEGPVRFAVEVAKQDFVAQLEDASGALMALPMVKHLGHAA